MNDQEWQEFKEAIEEGQELSFDYKGEEYWISRVLREEKSFLLTRSSDSYTQEFTTSDELFMVGLVEGKPFIKIVKDIE